MDKLIIQVARLLSLCLVLICGVVILTSFLLLDLQRQEEMLEELACGVIDNGKNQYDHLTLMDSTQIAGKQIFEQNCLACHSQNDEVVVGPGLKGITERRNKKWLVEWIQNPKNLLKKKDKYALQLYDKFSKVDMPGFAHLTEEDITAVLSYVEPKSFR